MAGLDLHLKIKDVDSAYQKLVDAHAGLSTAQSAALNARLILILLNHIGDESVIVEAIEAARSTGDGVHHEPPA